MMKYLVADIVGAVGIIAVSANASAAVVCNEEGDCWKVKEKYKYPPDVRLQIYEDDWAWPEADAARYRWRDPGAAGPGYWNKGVWIGL